MCAHINLEDACTVAHTWGLDDALEGLRPRPAQYFGFNSPQWQQYEAGYLAGIEHVFCLPSRSVRLALPAERIEIALSYLDIQEEPTYPPASREDKIRALARLGIMVQPNQTPIDAWVFAMCRANGLPEQRPAITIGEAALELCPKWLWWLA